MRTILRTGLAGLVVAAAIGLGSAGDAGSRPDTTPPATGIRGPATASQTDETIDRPLGEKRLTVEAIYASPPPIGRAPRALRWMPDSRRVSYLFDEGEGDARQTHFMAARVRDGKRETLCILDTIPVPEDLRTSDDTKFAFRSYVWAKERELALFRFKGEIFTFDAATGAVVRRTQSDIGEANVTFAPDGKSIAFTRDHDIWTMDLEYGQEVQLTTTGNDSIFNGVLDWVYMEELFTRGDVQAYWWSPDSRTIAYLQFDESPVETFPIVDFSGVYNTVEMQHYPKAGSPNPLVRVAIYHLETGETVWLDIDTSDDSYIARVYWLGDSGHVAMEKLNRNQDELRLLFADPSTGHVREVFKETRDTWIEVNYMWEVSALNDIDEKRGHVYLTALEKSFLERHLYRVGDNGEGFRRLSTRDGTHGVTFSPNHKHYIDRFSNASTPPVISIHDATGKLLFTLHDSSDADITEYELPAKEFFTIVSRDGLEFQCSIVKPPHFDPEEKYPVIIYVYGGPHAQVVRNRWDGTRYLWHSMMAQNGYIIFSLDNRGAYGKGAEWEDPVHKSLGNLELTDQITGVEHLKSLPYVDASRIGIWGWSYGGYMTCLAMFKEPGVFAAGAAVAPLADWRYYDTIYTERYMKRPEDNEEGYEDGSPINFVDGLEDPLLLIHGSADDNVHMQNTIQMIEALIDNGKDFDLMLYPGKTHGIGGNTARKHLFKRLTRFFERHLGPMSDTNSNYDQ